MLDGMQCAECGWIGYFSELESAMGFDVMCPVCGEIDNLHSLYEPHKWKYRWFYRGMAVKKAKELADKAVRWYGAD